MSIAARGLVGASGQFRFIRTNCVNLPGSGPNGEVQFSDLFEGSPQTGWRAKHPDRVVEDLTVKNKFTKRGLARMMHEILIGHINGPYAPSEVVSPTANCFDAFFMTADSPSGDGKNGDERVEFTESDTAVDVNVSANNLTAGEGKRALLTDDAAGILKNLSIAYRSTDPYGEGELIFYAQPNTPTYPTGSITTIVAANIVDGEFFTIDDGINGPVIFEFDKNDAYTAGRVRVDISGATTADDVRDEIIATINALQDELFRITASAGGAANVALTHDDGGVIGAITITENVTDAGFIVSGMTGGGGAQETGIKGLDNFPIMGVGLAAGIACGDGEADNKIGVRAIVGLAPTMQGKSDRVYQHEGKALNQYNFPPTEDDPTILSVDGYIQNGSLTEVQIGSDSTSAGASDTITAATRVIRITNAPTALPTTRGFRADVHTRKTLRIAGSVGSNNKDYTIERVVDTQTVVVFESPGADDNGGVNAFTMGLYTVYTGDKCFDGRVANEGRVAVDPNDGDPPGQLILGEYWASPDVAATKTVGRVWAATKTIAGIRIAIPAGVNKDFVPNNFTIEYLNQNPGGAPTGSERPGHSGDWNQTSLGPSTNQATAIFDAGLYGVEYTFTPVQCKGIRLTDMQAFLSTRMVQISVLYAYEALAAITLSGHTLPLKVKSGDAYKSFALPDVVSGDMNDIVASLNQALRGYQMEAVRSQLGYLWLRGTVAGSRSDLFINAEGGSDANTELGLPTGATQVTGITQPVRKRAVDALTLIYRVTLSGNVPGGYA